MQNNKFKTIKSFTNPRKFFDKEATENCRKKLMNSHRITLTTPNLIGTEKVSSLLFIFLSDSLQGELLDMVHELASIELKIEKQFHEIYYFFSDAKVFLNVGKSFSLLYLFTIFFASSFSHRIRINPQLGV